MLPGPAVPGCCLISFHLLWAVQWACPQAVGRMVLVARTVKCIQNSKSKLISFSFRFSLRLFPDVCCTDYIYRLDWVESHSRDRIHKKRLYRRMSVGFPVNNQRRPPNQCFVLGPMLCRCFKVINDYTVSHPIICHILSYVLGIFRPAGGPVLQLPTARAWTLATSKHLAKKSL